VKIKRKKERERNHIKVVQVKCKNQDLPGETIRENLDFLTKYIQKYIDKSKYEDEYIKVFWSGFRQGELSKDGDAWNEIVNKIKSIRDKMTELAKYSKYFSDYRLTKLDFDAPLPEVNDEEIIKNSSSENLYHIRTRPEIKIEKTTGFEDEKFYLSKVDSPETTLTGNAQIKLTGKDRSILFIMGPSELLRLLASLLDNWKSKPWNEIKENLLLPESFESFKAQKTELLNQVQGIRGEISVLQGEIDQIVYELYGLTEDEIKIVEGEENKRL
jgi:hypothetical protein